MRAAVLVASVWLVACEAQQTAPPLPIPTCTASPSSIDFGEADATIDGASVRSRVRLSNHSGVAHNIVVQPLGKPFSQLPVAGRFRLGGGATLDITIFFTPGDGLLHLDELEVIDEAPAGDACQLKVPLRGLGSGKLSLTGNGEPLDFGFMEPGGTQRLSLSVANSTRAPIPLGAVNVVFDTGFSVPEPVTLAPVPTLVVPASGELTFDVVAAPKQIGTVTGRVIFTAAHSALEAPFVLNVGRPEPEVFPDHLGPWLVEFSADAQPHGFSDRAVRFRNVGTSGPSSEAGLKITSVLVAGVASSSSELTVIVPPQAFLGLASGDSAELVFHLEPTSVGPRDFLVTLFTNSPSAPRVAIPVHATAEAIPYCDLEVSPAAELRLTAISDERCAGSVTFTNVGPNPCIVDDVRLTDGAELQYAIVNGALPQLSLLPGQQHTITILGPRTPAVTRVGAIDFHVFNAGSGTRYLDLYSTP